MKLRALVTLVVAAVAVAVFMAIPAFAANGGTARPYTNSGSQTGWINFSDFSYYLVGPVIGSHFGKGSVITSNPTGAVGTETDIYTAANGDTLDAIGLGDNVPLPPGFSCPTLSGYGLVFPSSQTLDYSGGTGRFADLTGQTVALVCNYVGPMITTGPNAGDYTFYVTFSEKGWLSS